MRRWIGGSLQIFRVLSTISVVAFVPKRNGLEGKLLHHMKSADYDK